MILQEPILLIFVYKPLEILCIEFLSLERSKGGFENMLVINDHFTSYAMAVPTRSQLAKTTAKSLFEHLSL